MRRALFVVCLPLVYACGPVGASLPADQDAGQTPDAHVESDAAHSTDGASSGDSATDAYAPTCPSALTNSDKPLCKTCLAAQCCAKAGAADSDSDYAAFVACNNTCGFNDINCAKACVAAHTVGAQKLVDFNQCRKSQCDLVCNHTPPYARVMQLSPNAGSIDWCWRETGTSAWQGPVVTALAYKKVANSYAFPHAGTIDVNVIAANGSCTAPIASSNAVKIAIDTQYEFALIGAKPAILVLTDEPTAFNTSLVRFVHASDGTGAISVSETQGGKLIGAMNFGAPWSGTNISANGALTLGPAVVNYQVWISTASSYGFTELAFPVQGSEITLFALPNGNTFEVVDCSGSTCQ